MKEEKTTEEPSGYRNLENMSVSEIISHINTEDKKVAVAVEHALPQLERLISAVCDKLFAGGRLIYIGAGTSGRLGILDASECPPTYGVPYGLVLGIIAGGHAALSKAVEFAEDSRTEGWNDLDRHFVNNRDFVIGLTASGSTPYVLGALEECKKRNILTGCIVCNKKSAVAREANFPVEIIVGPEFVTGSTRMKSGSAQKMALNMITTAVMIQLGRVQDNRMVNMQLTNEKLIDRGIRMVMEQLSITDYASAKELLLKHGSVKLAVENAHKN